MTNIIRTFFASLNDLDKAETLITKNCRFYGVRSDSYDEMPIYGTFEGAAGMRAFIGALRESFDTQLFEIDHVLETDTMGAAFGRFLHRVPKTGKLFPSHWALHSTFENGLMASYRFYEDTAALEDAFGCHTTSIENVA